VGNYKNIFVLDFKELMQRWKMFWDSSSGKRWSKIIQYFLTASIIAYLIYQLSEIGIMDVLTSLPTTPWFYLLFFILYFTLPITEQFIYRLSLHFSFWEGFKVFTQKKVLNADVLGYSGEAYFYVWGKKNLREDHKHIFNVIKDNNIISSFASTIIAALLLTYFASVVEIDFLKVANISKNVFIGVSILAAIVIALGLYFRKHIISMDTSLTMKVFVIHICRIIFIYSLEVVQWIIVLPFVPLHIWFVFLSAKIIASRIPFMPSQDLLFVSIVAALSGDLEYKDAIMAIMLMSTVLAKIMNFILYTVFMSLNKKKKLL